MRALFFLWLSTSLASAEEPGVQFSPLRIESAQMNDALGWKVTASILSDGLTGRVCTVRFLLSQGEKRWEETRKRAIELPQWNETSFYKRSFLGERFDLAQPIVVTFALIDLVAQKELGSVSGNLQVELSAPLVVEAAKVVHFGRVVYQGRVDLQPTWERIERGKKLRQERADGAIFSNLGHKLPHRPKAYWREYVHPTDGIRGAGPQRLIVGRGGELFYTPDFHKSFVQLR